MLIFVSVVLKAVQFRFDTLEGNFRRLNDQLWWPNNLADRAADRFFISQRDQIIMLAAMAAQNLGQSSFSYGAAD